MALLQLSISRSLLTAASTCQQNVLGNETANRAKDSSLKGACLTGRKSHGLNRVEGIWKDFKGKSKKNGWKITDDDLIAINGQRDQLEGRLQQRTLARPGSVVLSLVPEKRES